MDQAKDILKSVWGYDEFRFSQEEIINSVLEGKDVLALLPTGAGKSLCFQVPALVKPGLCIVVSPLIALIEDQISQLRKRGIVAEAIHSGLHKKQIDRILDNCIYGQIKFLYISPERIQTELFISRLERMNVNLIAVDESHCVSQWGHDFRPAYLKIADIRKAAPAVPMIALTATATTEIVQDIETHLELKTPQKYISSLKRENIRFIVRKQLDKAEKVVEICRKIGGSTIIYLPTRKDTKRFSEMLRSNGISAAYYHAGLDGEHKKKIQTEWIENKIRVICSTNAFGMGIDKSDVRLVIHPYLPLEPESYYQEAGRAGRDGQTSLSVIVYNDDDLGKIEHQIENKYPELDLIKRIYSLLYQNFRIAFGTGANYSDEFDLVGFSMKHGIPIYTLHAAIKFLEKAAYLLLQDYGRDRSKMIFLTSHTDIYKFQVVNPHYDDLLTVIIRSYGGLFEDYQNIDENEIAKRLKSTSVIVLEQLARLTELGVINYIPKTNKPLITFLENRVQEEYITLPKALYSDMKIRDNVRAKTMKELVTRSKCRLETILEYFGEKKVEPCGKCDFCSEISQLGVEQKRFREIQAAVKIALKKDSLSAADLNQKLPKFKTEEIASIVRWMVDNHDILLQENGELTLNSNKT